jgi:hypothetical protein
MISKDVYWGDVDVFNEAHVLRTWVKKATTKEGRTQHRVMYYTPTLGQPALVAADGYRIHAAWDVPKEVLLPSKRISRTVAIIGAARRSSKVWRAAQAWLKETNPMSDLLSKAAGQWACSVRVGELRRYVRQIERMYAADEYPHTVRPVYLRFNNAASTVEIYNQSVLIGTLKTRYAGVPLAPVVGLQLEYLRDALWVHHPDNDVAIALSTHHGSGEVSMLGVGTWMYRYALIMPLSMHAGKMPDVVRAEVQR